VASAVESLGIVRSAMWLGIILVLCELEFAGEVVGVALLAVELSAGAKVHYGDG
jgi:hypothetical protein